MNLMTLGLLYLQLVEEILSFLILYSHNGFLAFNYFCLPHFNGSDLHIKLQKIDGGKILQILKIWCSDLYGNEVGLSLQITWIVPINNNNFNLSSFSDFLGKLLVN